MGKGGIDALGIRRENRAERVLRLFSARRGVERVVRPQNFFNLATYTESRMKRDPGLLKDERDTSSANSFEFSAICQQQIPSLEKNLPLPNEAIRRQQSQQRRGQRALSRTLLAEDSEDFRRPQAQADAVKCTAQFPNRGLILNLEVADVQQRLHVQRRPLFSHFLLPTGSGGTPASCKQPLLAKGNAGTQSGGDLHMAKKLRCFIEWI